MKKVLSLVSFVLFLLVSCSPSNKIAKHADVFRQGALQHAHVGISIYDPERRQYLYNYQGEKYFIPASNVKIFTLYAGLKYLPDSLPGIHYYETEDAFHIIPTGDPSFLHPDFKTQPVFKKLKSVSKELVIHPFVWQDHAYGVGWSWDDYNGDYMAERSPLPVYGNVINWIQTRQENGQSANGTDIETFVFSEPEVNWKVRFLEDTSVHRFSVERKKDENVFEIHQGRENYKSEQVPFVTNGLGSALELLKDTLGREIQIYSGTNNIASDKWHTIYSQPSDSLFRIMLHRSDNFFAEQTLLMSAGEKFHEMNDEKMIDYLLQSDLKDLPQKPSWVDGSGLSRYNLFSPMDFTWILNRIYSEFGLNKIKSLFPTGNTGTLTGLYLKDSSFIYAKTGTLTANVALSGYLFTKHNRLLIFSILVNNHRATASAVRKTIEGFLEDLREW